MIPFKHEKVGDIESFNFNIEIVPEFIQYQGKIKKIVKIPNDYFKIREFRIIVNKNVVEDLIIMNAFHPNATPNPNEVGLKFGETPPYIQFFCLPENLKNKDMGIDFNIEHYIEYFIQMLKTYNYDSSYWIRWNGFTLIDYEHVIDKDDKKLEKKGKKENLKSALKDLGTYVISDTTNAAKKSLSEVVSSDNFRFPRSSFELELRMDQLLLQLERNLILALQRRLDGKQ